MHGSDLLRDVGISILAAAAAGTLATFFRLPLVVMYLFAGVLLGPTLGLGVITDHQSIETVSSIGLILLMFILGLEIHIDKLIRSGRAVLIAGILQVGGGALVVAMGFWLWGTHVRTFDLVYLAMAGAISSTLIVVKILSDRMELDSLPARLTLGILVIQDVFAIVFLAMQPNFANSNFMLVIGSIAKALLLVGIAWGAAKWILPRLLFQVARQTEVLLLLSLAWCFSLAGLARYLGLSAEMGALIAGVTLATFPYHADMAARISSLRDFFITLFFVSLGLQIPVPTWASIGIAAGLLGLMAFSRILTLIPGLLFLKYDLRIGVLLSVNLAQVSEFALVIATFGVAMGHISQDILSAIIFAMVISILVSSFAIPASHQIYRWVARAPRQSAQDAPTDEAPHLWYFLGFFRDASSIFEELKRHHGEGFKDRVKVIDFNPETHRELVAQGVQCMFGDISHPDSLRSSGISNAEVIICTLSDIQLKGATNLSLCRMLRPMAPKAVLVVTAENLTSAKDLYSAGADYVYVPRLVGAYYLADVLDRIQAGEGLTIRARAVDYLEQRKEILS